MTTLSDTQAQIATLQRQWEQAVAAGDMDTITSLFAENGVYLPATGGMAEGREAIRSTLEQDPAEAVSIRSSRAELLRENMLFDIGTFTVKLPEEAGGSFEGEYVSVSEIGENGLQIRSLTTFPVRQPPGSAGQF